MIHIGKNRTYFFRSSFQTYWLACGLLVVVGLLSLGVPAGTPNAVPTGFTPLEWNRLQSLATQAEYEFAWHDGSIEHPSGYYWAPNRAQGWQTAFTPQGVQVTPQNGAEWMWGLQLTGYGYTYHMNSLAGHTPDLQANKNTLTYQWNDTLSEWWINRDNGLEQGFTLLERPVGSGQFSVNSNQFSVGSGQFSVNSVQSALVFEMAIEGNLIPHLQGDTIHFTDVSGTTILTYDKLLVTDATGKATPAHFELTSYPAPDTSHLTPRTSHFLQIHINDSHATYPLTIDPWVQTAKLTASDSATNDFFGASVAMDGDTLVIGSWGDDDGGDRAGSAYVFVRPDGGWSTATETAKLTASDSAAIDLFGDSVDVDGDTIIIGATGDDDGGDLSGSAYVFVRPGGGWTNATETAKLTASDARTWNFFGISVGVSGDTIVVGAPGGKGGGFGTAYIFARPGGGWITTTETARLTASDAADGDGFAISVGIDSDTVVVGAPYDDDGGDSSGSAYVFARPGGGWMTTNETAKLTASDGAADDNFGNSVSLDNDTVVVGTPRDDDSGDSSGSAYVFVRPVGGWVTTTETAKLTASDAMNGDNFGGSVVVNGSTIVVGMPGNGIDAFGSAYVFTRPGGGWTTTTETEKLTASDGAVFDDFGDSVGISGNVIVIGAPGDDDAGFSSGSAYIFEGPTHTPTPTPTNTPTATPTNTPTATPTATPVVTDVELSGVSASSSPPSLIWLGIVVGVLLLGYMAWGRERRS